MKVNSRCRKTQKMLKDPLRSSFDLLLSVPSGLFIIVPAQNNYLFPPAADQFQLHVTKFQLLLLIHNDLKREKHLFIYEYVLHHQKNNTRTCYNPQNTIIIIVGLSFKMMLNKAPGNTEQKKRDKKSRLEIGFLSISLSFLCFSFSSSELESSSICTIG